MLVTHQGLHAERRWLTRRGQCQALRSWARVLVRGREVHGQFVSRRQGRSPQKRHPKGREECRRGAESRGRVVSHQDQDGAQLWTEMRKISEAGRTGRTEKQTEEGLERDVSWKLKFP